MDKPITISRDLLFDLYRHIKPLRDVCNKLETILYRDEDLTNRVETYKRIDALKQSRP